MGLSADQVEHFNIHGFIAPIDVMSPEEAGVIRAKLEAAEAAYPEHLHAEHRNHAHLIFPFLAELTIDDRIVDPVESLVGPDISLWSTVLFIKAPQSGSFVSWHQDSTYMAVTRGDHVTAWLALSPSTRESGCVSVIPGTHTRGIVDHVDTYGENNILTRGQVVPDVDTDSAVDLVLAPGQMSLHHPWLVHGSQPNRTDDRRIGIAMQTYMAPNVLPTRGDHVVTYVRGAPTGPAYTELPLPTEECTPEAIAHRATANKAFADILYEGAAERRKL